MSPAPGTTVVSRAAAARGGASADTGTWFAAGLTDKGPVGAATEITSLDAFVDAFGARQSYSSLYDALDLAFRTGLGRAIVSRAVGPGAQKATLTLNDRAGTPLATLRVDAINAGEYGNNITVTVTSPDGSHFQIAVTDGVVSESSGPLAAVADAVTWAATSQLVRIANLGSVSAGTTAFPANLTATHLATGSSDRASITVTQWTSAIDAFTRDLGPGQVSIPGVTSATVQEALITHASTNGRTAILDAADTSVVSDLTTAASTVQTAMGTASAYGALFAPWIQVPGLVAGTVRIVPPSGAVAGLLAAEDRAAGPGHAAAGVDHGIVGYGIGVTQTFTESQRSTLNDAGVDLVRLLPVGVALYGYRTLSSELVFRFLNAQRVRAQIEVEARQLGDSYGFVTITPAEIARFNGDLRGVLLAHYLREELFGATPVDAYNVDTGPTVNTPTTLGSGELRAVLEIRPSPVAERVSITIVAFPITEVLPS